MFHLPTPLRFTASVCAWLCFCLAQSTFAVEPIPSRSEERLLQFERDVRPILKAYCWNCHGEEPELGGGLDTRLVRTLNRGGESGPAFIAANSADSLLMKRVLADEMPPGDKKLNAAQRQILADWIDAGAKHARPEPAELPIGEVLTDDDRSHWSFQPIKRPELPQTLDAKLARTALDAFLLARLESVGQSFNPEADRGTLVRRLTFDLLGLPPTADEVEMVQQDKSEDWYERLVDRLLASPAYGERWSRHWLDVVGYADSNGYTEKDSPRQWTWKYRDYVIRSFNEDRPWDRFIVEQLAGDELVSPPHRDLGADDTDRLIATAFLRLVPDGTGESGVNANEARNDTIAESLKVVSSSLLGLTVGCAQCHSHRYDPISHTDYYRMRAVFAPALNVQDWKRPQDRLISLWSEETRRLAENVDAEQACIKSERDDELDVLVATTFERELEKLPEEIRTPARIARSTAAKERTDDQKSLIKQYPFLNVDRGSVYLYQPDRQTGFNKKWEERIKVSLARRPAEDYVFAVIESGSTPPPTHLFARGDINQPREIVEPIEIEVLRTKNTPSQFCAEVLKSEVTDDPGIVTSGNVTNNPISTSGRRLAYGKYLTSGEHPLVARVLVNRFWRQFFGRGIVATTGDFGLQGERPTHPELLDWLARDFMDHGWELKRLQRMIVTSTAYRQSSARREELESIDADNRLLGRMPLRRLEAEVLRDAVLFTSGQLSSKRFGPGVPVAPDEVGQYIIGNDNRDSAGRPQGKRATLGEDEVRRTIYVQVRRSMPLSILEPFDNPVMSPNCEQRASSTVATQSLVLMNSQFAVEAAEAMVVAMEAEAGDDPAARIRWAIRRVLSREPTSSEIAAGLDMMAAPRAAIAGESNEPSPQSKEEAEELNARWVALCHALLCTTRYVMVE